MVDEVLSIHHQNRKGEIMTGNVGQIGGLSIREQAEREVAAEKGAKAKEAIKAKLKALDTAQSVVKNIEREIADLEASIADGSF
jgi:hypothetical protein